LFGVAFFVARNHFDYKSNPIGRHRQSQIPTRRKNLACEKMNTFSGNEKTTAKAVALSLAARR
jgi:hypothetical protein